MMRFLLFLVLSIVAASGHAQLRVSGNGRFLLRDGKPFFWLGDTAWELFHRLNRDDAGYYLKHRAEQGFTVIQAVILAELDGLHTPNANGDLPLINDDPAKPNEAYFRYVDTLISMADRYGLVMGLLPTWGDKVWKSTWGKGPEVFNPQNARLYGRWLGSRYGGRKNIIWILGGDRNPQNDTHVTIWREMAAGIIEGAGPERRPLMTFHPQPHASGSAHWFHEDGWLSFNMFQNGHCRNTPVYDKIRTLYDRRPVKPVLDGEPLYEDHPVCFNAADLGTSNAYDVRMFAYLDVFAGAFGHTYGCHGIWQFYAPGREGVNGPHMYWRQAMDLPGARQMAHLRKLIESGPVEERVPDQDLIRENDLPAAGRIQAARGRDYAYIYSCAGRPFTVNLGRITGTTLQSGWYNPRNGGYKPAGSLPNTGSRLFTPPSAGYGHDWVLVLQDAARPVAL